MTINWYQLTIKEVVNKVIRLSLILCLFMHASIQAQAPAVSYDEFDPTQDILSDKYVAGPHLIYDCEDKHWVCVAPEEKKECEDLREKRRLDKQRQLKCTSFKSFDDKKSCFKFQQTMVTSATDPAWTCTASNWRFQNIKFE